MVWMIGGSSPGRGLELFTTASGPALGPTQPPIQRVREALYRGVKRPGSETDHSPPSSAEIKNAWSYTSTPQYTFMAWCSFKAQGQLYLYLLSCKSHVASSGRMWVSYELKTIGSGCIVFYDVLSLSWRGLKNICQDSRYSGRDGIRDFWNTKAEY
jgi:hypothetical protein